MFLVCGAAAGAGVGASVSSVLLATALASGLTIAALTQVFAQLSGKLRLRRRRKQAIHATLAAHTKVKRPIGHALNSEFFGGINGWDRLSIYIKYQ